VEKFTVQYQLQPDENLSESPAADERPARFDFDYGIGLASLLFSLGIFSYGIMTSTMEGTFLLPYFSALFYLVWLMHAGKLRWFWKKQRVEYLHHRLLLGYIWLISCFALNRVMPIFNPSAQWLTIAIMIAGTSAIIYTWEAYLPRVLKSVLFALMSCSAVLWIYYAAYLLPLYLLSIPGLILLGISVHSFIPLLLSTTYLRLLYIRWEEFKHAALVGIIIPVAVAILFSLRWYQISKSIQYQTNAITARSTNDLPNWIMLARQMPDDWVTRRVVMGKKVYQFAPSSPIFVPESISTDIPVKHDPLVLVASLFSKDLDLGETERINILNVLYNTRHETQDRLWSGSDLRTAYVLTQARIYPYTRVAYTEKTISIANRSGSSFSQEEALYTFYLPEGSVVSSLSLWINGIEEKSLLAAQTKADSAYKTIVGTEVRDPSVVHWQEGNTVKVKVFPCTAGENRKFKIGITTPLKADSTQLVYENIWFKGPGADDARETIRLEFPKELHSLHLPFEPMSVSPGIIIHEGTYRSSWQAGFKIAPIGKESFSFGGKTYAVEPLHKTLENFHPKAYYLDINRAWTDAELDTLWSLLKNRPVFVANEHWVALTGANKDELFAAISAFNFSLAPIQDIPDPENALLITKASTMSPTLHDLANTPFSKTLSRHPPRGLRTFIIGDEASQYIKSLDELSVIRAVKTDWAALKQMISRNQFPSDPEADPSVISIERSRMLIRETQGDASGPAPDHLLRLFAYNHIMKQVGGRFLDRSFQTDTVFNAKLIREAEMAHIVTPVSSMVVLESQKDYDRFDIRKSKNSLDNATMKVAGAVPEPHEWLLIILFCMIVGYFTFRHYVH
jgi:XrtN system VIT domain protein